MNSPSGLTICCPILMYSCSAPNSQKHVIEGLELFKLKFNLCYAFLQQNSKAFINIVKNLVSSWKSRVIDAVIFVS